MDDPTNVVIRWIVLDLSETAGTIHTLFASIEFPRPLDTVMSTVALTLVPEYDQVIQKAGSALPTGKRFVILDSK